MKKDINEFINTLQESIITWDYFVDFLKAQKGTFKIRVQLNILNSLIGERNLKEKFLMIITRYPETREALLILIATRKSKIGSLPIINPVSLIAENKKYLFDDKKVLTKKSSDELWNFFVETGLMELFKNKKINNLEDYVFGVEVGLDSNARKNRTGTLMENRVEFFISKFCEQHKFKYITQATKTKIFDQFGIKIKMQGEVKNKNGERKFDFAVCNNKNKLTLIEVNYYSSTGSKPSSIAREYVGLCKILNKEGIEFVWVTDGVGWKKMKNPLGQAINEIENVINLSMLKQGILNEVFKQKNVKPKTSS